ncbi:MFS transporter [Sphingomonas sp. AR_OL41]|uniref:MFS transporter n=1 Tax=Sphingomonas sp. AR_OL41 TaxID=3042729 RepID=UPI0024816BEB|nr:MFS transporter [Sphingomonas sp. AR_OL41]MDH7973252.1 MFS transporter [Sphingomonas sp. AR_OL41]
MAATPIDILISPAQGAAPAGLGRGAMIAWGIGTLGPVTVLTATNALLLRFLTDNYGIAAGVGASLIAISKFYDAFADVAMGVASDRTVSRWGRRRPYLILGAILLALSVLAIFGAPSFASEQARLIYMGAILIFYASAYTVFNVPYMAMPGEMTRSYHERSELMRWRVYAVGLAIIIASAAGPKLLDLFGGNTAAYGWMAVVFAPIVVAAGVIAFAGTADAPSTARVATHYSFRQQFASAVANRPFAFLILVKFITLMALGVQSVFPFFFQRILAVPNSVLGTYFLCQSAMFLVAPSLWLWLAKRVGKKRTLLTALAISIPVYFSWAFAAQGEPLLLVYLRGVIIGVSGSGVILMGQSMLPDTMEYDFRRTGLRREGIFAALYTTVEKLSGAIGVSLIGALLGAYGYVQSRGPAVVQPESALWAIRVAMAYVPALISLAGMAALLGYDLDERKLAEAGAA